MWLRHTCLKMPYYPLEVSFLFNMHTYNTHAHMSCRHTADVQARDTPSSVSAPDPRPWLKCILCLPHRSPWQKWRRERKFKLLCHTKRCSKLFVSQEKNIILNKNWFQLILMTRVRSQFLYGRWLFVGKLSTFDFGILYDHLPPKLL